MHDGVVVEKLDIAGLQRHVEIDSGPGRDLGDETDGARLYIGQFDAGAFYRPVDGRGVVMAR